jgi:SpoVK/Ycf46/Vps4 family AAA+-type ATPase
MLRDVRLEKNFDYDELAHRTRGKSGSDLKEICRQACMTPVREVIRDKTSEGIEAFTAVCFTTSNMTHQEGLNRDRATLNLDSSSKATLWHQNRPLIRKTIRISPFKHNSIRHCRISCWSMDRVTFCIWVQSTLVTPCHGIHTRIHLRC